MIGIHPFFDCVYLINLDRRSDRLADAMKECSNNRIHPLRVSAVDGTVTPLWNPASNLKQGENGLIMTVIHILNDAKAMKLKSILILEDDIMFSNQMNHIGEYLAALPEDWDMLYGSGNHNLHVQGVTPPQVINDKILKVHETYSTHFIGIRGAFYDTLLQRIDIADKPLDVMYAELQKKHNVYCFNATPPLCTQRNGHSDIVNSYTDYSWLIK